MTDDLYRTNDTFKTDDPTVYIKTDGMYGRKDGTDENSSTKNLYSVLIKLDLTKLKDAVDGSQFILHLHGGTCGSPSNTSKGFNTVKVLITEYSDCEWNESNTPNISETDSFYDIVSNGKEIITTYDAKAEVIDYNPVYIDHAIDLTGFIQSKIKTGETETTIALFADNTEAEQLYDQDGEKNQLKFQFYSKDCETEAYKPYIEYYKSK